MSTLGAQTKMADDTKSVARSATTKHTSGTSRSISGKLNTMADDFNNFYGDLEEETTIRKQAEEQRVILMEKELVKIESVLSTETKRRIEAGKALQNMFEAKVQALQKKFKFDLRECFEPLQAQVDSLVARVELLETTMENERRDREKEIQKANKEVLDKFAEHQKQFEVEKVTRLQREAQTLKRVGDEVFRIQQKVTAERTARESAITLMKDDFMTAHKVRPPPAVGRAAARDSLPHTSRHASAHRLRASRCSPPRLPPAPRRDAGAREGRRGLSVGDAAQDGRRREGPGGGDEEPRDLGGAARQRPQRLHARLARRSADRQPRQLSLARLSLVGCTPLLQLRPCTCHPGP